jgi:Protein of unknown function (DUF4242)
MPTYLVERYLPGRNRDWLEAALARLPKETRGVAYLGSLYVPSDESCFCRFEAADAESVREANELARVPFARIVESTELGITVTGHHKEGGSA